MTCGRSHRTGGTLRSAAVLCVLLAVACGTSADVVYLKSGGTLRGDVVAQDETTVTLKMRHGTIEVLRSRIASIRKEAEQPKLLDEAERLVREGKRDEAIRTLEDAHRRFPSSEEVRTKLVEACRARAGELEASGSPVEANRLYQRILDLSVSDPQAVERTKTFTDTREEAGALESEAKLLADLERWREALEIFDRLGTPAPDLVERNRHVIARCHAGYARRLLEVGRHAHARIEYNKALALEPKLLDEVRHDLVLARFKPIVDEINQRERKVPPARWESLAADLKALIALEPENLHLQFALGFCHQALRDWENASRQYCVVLGREPVLEGLPEVLEPLRLAAQNRTHESPMVLSTPAPRFTDVLPGPPCRLETKHFVILHHNHELAQLVARGAEYYLERNYRVFLEAMPENPWPVKCRIHLYRSQQEYLRSSAQATWSPAMASTRGVGGQLLGHHVKTYQSVENLLCSHLSHELTHIIHGAVVGYDGRIPTWLREGTAVRREPWFKRLQLARAIREAHDAGKRMSLEQILTQQGYPPEEQVKLFYAQSYALVETLEQAGTRDQFTRFNREAMQKDALKAVELVYGLSRQQLVESWEKHEGRLMELLEAP